MPVPPSPVALEAGKRQRPESDSLHKEDPVDGSEQEET